MSEGENKAISIVENGYVRLCTLVGAVIFCVGGAWKIQTFTTQDALWKQEVKRDILDLDKSINSEDKWGKGEMRNWVERSKKLNPDWHPATVDIY